MDKRTKVQGDRGKGNKITRGQGDMGLRVGGNKETWEQRSMKTMGQGDKRRGNKGRRRQGDKGTRDQGPGTRGTREPHNKATGE